MKFSNVIRKISMCDEITVETSINWKSSTFRSFFVAESSQLSGSPFEEWGFILIFPKQKSSLKIEYDYRETLELILNNTTWLLHVAAQWSFELVADTHFSRVKVVQKRGHLS